MFSPRSPRPSGQNGNRRTVFQRLWQVISNTLRFLFQGSQRPAATRTRTITRPGRDSRNYDLEIQEFPVRNTPNCNAQLLIEMAAHSDDASTAFEIIVDDVQSSASGDDRGFWVARNLRDGTPIREEVRAIVQAAIDRCLDATLVDAIAERMLAYGDCFAEIDIDTRTQSRQVNGLLLLPTWEMFRCEENGILIGFEQRRYLGDTQPFASFHPIRILHWRFRRGNLYGRGQFHESTDTYEELRDLDRAILKAANDLGVAPMLHIMPEDCDEEAKEIYRQENEEYLKNGPITHYYMDHGGTVTRISGSGDLKALLDARREKRRVLIAKSRVPPYLMGLILEGAKDIANQPAQAYARFISAIRQKLSLGFAQIGKTELALKGIDPRAPENRFRFEWARFTAVPNPMGGDSEASETEIEQGGEPGESRDRAHLSVV